MIVIVITDIHNSRLWYEDCYSYLTVMKNIAIKHIMHIGQGAEQRWA
jgi:hypothetical protein